jgi:hypothetical protein
MINDSRLRLGEWLKRMRPKRPQSLVGSW